jgi:hypothetical protein
MVPARDFVPALAPNSAVRQAACRQAHDVLSRSNMRSSRRGRLHCLAGLSRDRPRFRIRRAFPKHRAPGFKYSRVPPSGSATIRREGQARRHRERRDQRRIGGQRNIYRFAIAWRQRRCHRSASRLGRYNSRVRRRQASSSRTSEAYAQQFVGAFSMSALRRRATARNCRHILKEYAR